MIESAAVHCMVHAHKLLLRWGPAGSMTEVCACLPWQARFGSSQTRVGHATSAHPAEQRTSLVPYPAQSVSHTGSAETKLCPGHGSLTSRLGC